MGGRSSSPHQDLERLCGCWWGWGLRGAQAGSRLWSGLASLPVLSVGLGQELLAPGSLDTGQQEVAVPVELGCPGHGAMWGATF